MLPSRFAACQGGQNEYVRRRAIPSLKTISPWLLQIDVQLPAAPSPSPSNLRSSLPIISDAAFQLYILTVRPSLKAATSGLAS